MKKEFLFTTLLASGMLGVSTTTLPVHAETTNTDANNVSENQETRITPEMVADAKVEADNAKDAVTTKAQEIADKVQADAATTTELTQIKTEKEAVVEQKTAEVAQKQTEVNNAQNTVNNTTDEVTDRQSEIDTLTQNTQVSELQEANAQVSTAQDNVNRVAAEQTTATQSLPENLQTSEGRQTALTQAQGEQATAQNTVTEKQQAVNHLQAEIDNTQVPYTHDIALMPEWVEAFKAHWAIKSNATEYIKTHGFDKYDQDYNDTQRRLEALDKAAIEYDKARTRKTPTTDNTAVVDPNNLSQEDRYELAELVVNYLNSLRRQLGLDDNLKINRNEMEFAQEIADVYVRDGRTIRTGHYGKGINEVADKRGLLISERLDEETTRQYYENLGGIGFGTNTVHTKQTLFKEFMDYMHRFIFEGYQNYGHLHSLVTNDTIGVSVSKVDDLIHIHIIGVSVSDLHSTYGNPYGRRIYENSYGRGSSAIDVTSNRLRTLKQELADAQTDLTTKTQAVETLTQTIEQLNDIQTRLQSAQTVLTQATQRRDDLQAEETARLQLITTKQAELDALRETLREQEATLNTAKQTLTTAQSELQSAQDELQTATTTLTTHEQTSASQLSTLNDTLRELSARYASALEYYEKLVVQLNAQTAVDNAKDNTDNNSDNTGDTTDTSDITDNTDNNTGDNSDNTDNTGNTDNTDTTGNKKDDYHEGVVDLSWLTNLKNPEDSPEANKFKTNKPVASSPKEQKTTKRVDRATLPQTGEAHNVITQIAGASLLLGSGYTFTRRKNRRK